MFPRVRARVAQLLGGFRRNLLIVSRVTPTPGCTAKSNFPGNRYSQPLILRPFGRSGLELPVEYPGTRSHHFSAVFRCLPLKKAVDRGQHLGIVCIRGPLVKERCHRDSTSTKIIGKPHRKNPTFYVFTPWLFLYFVGIHGVRYRNFSQRKIQKFKNKISENPKKNDHL